MSLGRTEDVISWVLIGTHFRPNVEKNNEKKLWLKIALHPSLSLSSYYRDLLCLTLQSDGKISSGIIKWKGSNLRLTKNGLAIVHLKLSSRSIKLCCRCCYNGSKNISSCFTFFFWARACLKVCCFSASRFINPQ